MIPPGAMSALEASAVPALLFGGPGTEDVADAITGRASTSTVNLSEVATVLARLRRRTDEILAPLCEQIAIEPFTDADALAAAALHPRTYLKGLSLGDRACLALAQRLSTSAMTAEHAWSELDLDIEIQQIRKQSGA